MKVNRSTFLHVYALEYQQGLSVLGFSLILYQIYVLKLSVDRLNLPYSRLKDTKTQEYRSGT